jgi:glycosyltransferase XagB
MLHRPIWHRQSFSAVDGASTAQIVVFVATLALLALALGAGLIGMIELAMLAAPLFLLLIAIQLGALVDALAAEKDRSSCVTSAVVDWPVYSILIALRHEARMANQLVNALGRLDYPQDKLDVLFLVEADDVDTAEAFERAGHPYGWRVMIVPPGGPLTKPNALNYGLRFAKGALITVFDAEDLPDPGQLRMAAERFRLEPPVTMALQAHLEFDNEADGWLPKMMAIEYAALFELTKPGLAAAGFPVALGGTSNHFRTADLIRLGGWDSGNVTEDAELGLRIARAGGKIADLPSVTREEAPISFRAWFRQRRRWLKGWMQTAITHGRNPWLALQQAGPINYIIGMAQMGGVVMGVLLFPPFFLLTCLAMTRGIELGENPSALVAQAIAVVTFCLGAVAVFLPAWLGLRRQGKTRLVPWMLLLPVYLMLVSAAGWFAVIDLIRRPLHWAKTEHGLGTRIGSEPKSRPEQRS